MTEKVKVTTDYRTHNYTHEWEKISAHCPECGKQPVWVECSDGDYYVGPQYACAACGALGHMWWGDNTDGSCSARNAEGVTTDNQIIHQLREADKR